MTAIVAALTLAVILWSLLAWRKAAAWFVALSPLWYAPFLFLPDAYGEQWASLRAGKDWVSAGLLATWVVTVLRRGSLVWVTDACAILAGLFVLIGSLRLATLDAGQAVTVARIFVLAPLWFFAGRDLFVDDASTWQNLRRWAVVGAVVSLVAVVEYALGGSDNIFSRASGQVRAISTLFNPNALGWYLVWANGLLLGWTLRARADGEGRLPAQVAIGGWVLNAVAIGLSGSRSAFAIAVATLGVWFMLTSRRVVAAAALSAMSVGAVVAWFVVILPRLDDLRLFSGSDTLRWAIYTEAAANFVRADPVQVLVGFDAALLETFDAAGIFDDSFWVALVGYGGAVALLLLAVLVVLTVVAGVTARDRSPRAPFLFAAVAFAVLGMLGNVQAIFPHGMLFWVSLGLASRPDRRRVGPSDAPESRRPNVLVSSPP